MNLTKRMAVGFVSEVVVIQCDRWPILALGEGMNSKMEQIGREVGSGACAGLMMILPHPVQGSLTGEGVNHPELRLAGSLF